MKLTLISDTHGLHRQATLPPGDVLIHAGDFLYSGRDAREIVAFNEWLGQQPYTHKICIAGNHDWLFQENPGLARRLLTNATYLENSGVTIDGVNFWGSPVQPAFMNWAFNVQRGAAIRRYWDMIPAGTDVLITHGPPYGIHDTTHPGGEHLGCEELLTVVAQKAPRLNVFGHIHGGFGVSDIGRTTFANAAFLDEHYRPADNPTILVTLQPRPTLLPSAKSCDCWKYERQICDVCQGVGVPGKFTSVDV